MGYPIHIFQTYLIIETLFKNTSWYWYSRDLTLRNAWLKLNHKAVVKSSPTERGRKLYHGYYGLVNKQKSPPTLQDRLASWKQYWAQAEDRNPKVINCMAWHLEHDILPENVSAVVSGSCMLGGWKLHGDRYSGFNAFHAFNGKLNPLSSDGYP